jgi:hypothetical protein
MMRIALFKSMWGELNLPDFKELCKAQTKRRWAKILSLHGEIGLPLQNKSDRIIRLQADRVIDLYRKNGTWETDLWESYKHVKCKKTQHELYGEAWMSVAKHTVLVVKQHRSYGVVLQEGRQQLEKMLGAGSANELCGEVEMGEAADNGAIGHQRMALHKESVESSDYSTKDTLAWHSHLAGGINGFMKRRRTQWADCACKECGSRRRARHAAKRCRRTEEQARLAHETATNTPKKPGSHEAPENLGIQCSISPSLDLRNVHRNSRTAAARELVTSRFEGPVVGISGHLLPGMPQPLMPGRPNAFDGAADNLSGYSHCAWVHGTGNTMALIDPRNTGVSSWTPNDQAVAVAAMDKRLRGSEFAAAQRSLLDVAVPLNCAHFRPSRS